MWWLTKLMYSFIIGKITIQNVIELYSCRREIIAIGVLANAKLNAIHASPPTNSKINLIIVLKVGLIVSQMTKA